MIPSRVLAAAMIAVMAHALPAFAAFPEIRARDLNGAEVATREHRGKPTVYLLGFSYESRDEVERWARALAAMPPRSGATRIVQMPVLSGAGVWARSFIESGLTKKTPKADRPNVMTTTDREALVKGLRLADPDRGAVVVAVDGEGEVRLILRGGPSEAKEKELAAALGS